MIRKLLCCSIGIAVLLICNRPARAQTADPDCDGQYPRHVRLLVEGKLTLEGDRLAFTHRKRAERFITKGRYGNQVLYPLSALFDDYPETRFVRFDACGMKQKDISAEQVRAEPWRYYLWNRKVQNGYLKFMDFVEALKGSTLEPNTEPGRNGGAIAPQKRILTRGISGNPEVIRFIHTITLSKDPLSKPAATPAQPESTGRPAPGAKPGRGKGKK
ncbi:MAG: hypothetical protein KDH09_20250 [Chrysiogenetes bacterium]|nr:hypothetical protein [Chrysiogenetes bacterium]